MRPSGRTRSASRPSRRRAIPATCFWWRSSTHVPPRTVGRSAGRPGEAAARHVAVRRDARCVALDPAARRNRHPEFRAAHGLVANVHVLLRAGALLPAAERDEVEQRTVETLTRLARRPPWLRRTRRGASSCSRRAGSSGRRDLCVRAPVLPRDEWKRLRPARPVGANGRRALARALAGIRAACGRPGRRAGGPARPGPAFVVHRRRGRGDVPRVVHRLRRTAADRGPPDLIPSRR
jgi:hypothetical protein